MYRSYIYDWETQLYYLNSRYYDPEIGRFLNPDEPTFIGSGNSLSPNTYVYCDNDPVNHRDNTGYAIVIDDITLLLLGTLLLPIFINLIHEATPYVVDGIAGLVASLNKAFDKVKSDISTFVCSIKNYAKDIADGWAIVIATLVEGIAKANNNSRPSHKHHIVAQRALRALPGRYVLKKVGIEIDSSSNTIYLRPILHARLHTSLYYNLVNAMVSSAYLWAVEKGISTKESVKGVLNLIKSLLNSINKYL